MLPYDCTLLPYECACSTHALTAWPAELLIVACAQAVRRGAHSEARQCGYAVLAFLEATLAHCLLWHPAVSEARYQLAGAEAALGEPHAALGELGRALMALMITHGPDHPLTLRSEERQREYLIAAEIERRVRGLRANDVPEPEKK